MITFNKDFTLELRIFAETKKIVRISHFLRKKNDDSLLNLTKKIFQRYCCDSDMSLFNCGSLKTTPSAHLLRQLPLDELRELQV